MTIIHRLRAIGRMAGPDRVDALDDIFHKYPIITRRFTEPDDLRGVAVAGACLVAHLGIETLAHSNRLALWTRMLGVRMGAEDRELLHCGALLHDIGKIAIPLDVLESPRALGPTELDGIRMRASLGHSVLFGLPALSRVAQFVLHHHEYWDGSGYGGRLSGNNIPLACRVFSVVDAFEAMTRRDRPFRMAVSPKAAREELRLLAGSKYDPDAVTALMSIDPARWDSVMAVHPDVLERERPSRRPSEERSTRVEPNAA